MAKHADELPEPSKYRPLLAVLGLVLGLSTMLSLLVVMTQVGKPKETPKALPQQSLQELQAANEQSLGSYGWVDQKKGVVRIPIDVAMEKLIEERKVNQCVSESADH